MSLSVAIIGTGLMFRLMTPFLDQLFVISRIGTRSIDLTREKVSELGLRSLPVIGSYEDVFNDDDIDFVYIATPAHTHNDLVRKCLDAGKHVLCEKPFNCGDIVSATELSELAMGKNLVLMEALWTNYLPSMVALKNEVSNWDSVEYFSCSMGIAKTPEDTPLLFDRENGGGAHLACGCYPFSITLWLFGDDCVMVNKEVDYNHGVDVHGKVELQSLFKGKPVPVICECAIDRELDSSIIIRGSLNGVKQHLTIPFQWWEKNTYDLTRGKSEPITITFEQQEIIDYKYELIHMRNRITNNIIQDEHQSITIQCMKLINETI